MAGKHNPIALHSSWHLKEDFDVTVLENVAVGTRQRTKKYGNVSDMRFTEKGRVDNKTDQVLMLLSTTTQKEDEPPFAFQVAKLTYTGLRHDLLAKLQKALPAKPTFAQLARKSTSHVSSFFAHSLSHVCR